MHVCENSVAWGHYGGNRVHVDLLCNIPRLDDLFLARDSHEVVRAHLPSVHLDPRANSVLLNQTEQLAQNRLLNSLVGDANDVANKLSDRIFKALYTGHQVCLSVNLLPEHLELTHLQQISKVKQSLHLGFVKNLLVKTLLYLADL